MTNLVFSPKEKVVLEKANITGLILFGSQARGTASEKSDYDVFVLGKKSTESYDLVYEFLSEKINKLTNIDIVFDSDAPMELKNHVAKYGVVLYESQPNVFPNFRQHTMLIYSDFAPYRQMFQEATLKRINS